jgi:hypothetical protein
VSTINTFGHFWSKTGRNLARAFSLGMKKEEKEKPFRDGIHIDLPSAGQSLVKNSMEAFVRKPEIKMSPESQELVFFRFFLYVCINEKGYEMLY